MKRLFIILTALALSLMPFAGSRAATLAPGDLIKASGPAVYYYHSDGTRLVFPNEKTYFTWYSDFSNIVTLTDAELAAIPIGGNVTYRPGTRMIKITTDPRVYAVGENRSLRWVQTETVAEMLYGSDWAAMIDDIADAFFVDYNVGDAIASSSEYDPEARKAAAQTIADTRDAADQEEPSEEEPTEEEPGTEEPAQTASVSIQVSKSDAQANEVISITAETDYDGVITTLDIFEGTTLIKECPSTNTCSVDFQIPLTGVADQYDFKAVVETADDGTFEDTTSINIVTEAPLSSIVIDIARPVMREGQEPNITVRPGPDINANKIEIYIDDVSEKICTSAPLECKYTDYIEGGIGSVHTIYARVQTPGYAWYRSDTKTITISDNDAPQISAAAGKVSITTTETVDITASANDDDGIASVEILRNGVTLKTCLGAAPCTVIVGPYDLPSGTVVSFDVVAIDLLGLPNTKTGATAVTIL